MPRRSALLARFMARPLPQRIALVVVGLLLLPYVLIVLYILPFVHPVSTLMLRDAVTFQGMTADGFPSTRYRRCWCDRSWRPRTGNSVFTGV